MLTHNSTHQLAYANCKINNNPLFEKEALMNFAFFIQQASVVAAVMFVALGCLQLKSHLKAMV